jgi:hypothetical protein
MSSILYSLKLGWSRNRIFFYFAKYEMTTKVILISRNFAKLFHYINFSNTSTFREILHKLFREIVSLCKFFEFNTQIRIIGSGPDKKDIDTYKCLWIFDIKVIFLVVWNGNNIQKCILPCENFNFFTKTKFREISEYFAIRNFAK